MIKSSGLMFAIGLGHPRPIETDLNLILQIVTLIIIFASLFLKKSGKVKLHGATMGIAVLLHILSLIAVMGPSFSQSIEFYIGQTSFLGVQTAWIHAIPGGIAILLGVLLVALWAAKPSNIAPCYKRKRIMDATLALWLISIVFGIATYVFFYA